jgi:hypothetical protein
MTGRRVEAMVVENKVGKTDIEDRGRSLEMELQDLDGGY